MAFVAIKMGRPARREERSISRLIRERRATQPLAHFHRNPPGRGQLAVFPRCSLLRIHSDMLVARSLENSQLADGETHVSYGTGHLNQSRRDRAARDTSGFHPLPQLLGESVDEFFLPPASDKACHAAGPAEADLRRGRPSST